MSGIGGSEFLLLCLIGLLILGPERLPRVARQLGTWLGKARQMTRALQRQLEEEVEAGKDIGAGIRSLKELKDIHPEQLLTPRDDDTYSPLHDEEEPQESARETDPERDPEADDAGSAEKPGEKTA